MCCSERSDGAVSSVLIVAYTKPSNPSSVPPTPLFFMIYTRDTHGQPAGCNTVEKYKIISVFNKNE